MKKEEAFEAMKNGAVISHISWKNGTYIWEGNGSIFDNDGKFVIGNIGLEDGWLIVYEDSENYLSQSEQIQKTVPLHLKHFNRMWCYSDTEIKDMIAKEIIETSRAINSKL